MKKSDIVKAVATDGLSLEKAQSVVNSALDIIQKSLEKEEPVRLRIYMRNAKLYSLWTE